jgi:sensor histidine kinase regulating citrate/malate metabolism
VDRKSAQDLISKLSASIESSDELFQFLGDFSPDRSSACSVHQATQRALNLLENSLIKHQIDFHKEIPLDSDVKVPFHVLSNTIAIIVDNAKDAISRNRIKKGSIRIKVTPTDDQKVFHCDISNSGPGVPDRIRKSLFKAPVTSGKEKGHGVGLYFSAYVLRLYGAQIMLMPEDTHPETTFRIQLPR